MRICRHIKPVCEDIAGNKKARIKRAFFSALLFNPIAVWEPATVFEWLSALREDSSWRPIHAKSYCPWRLATAYYPKCGCCFNQQAFFLIVSAPFAVSGIAFQMQALGLEPDIAPRRQ